MLALFVESRRRIKIVDFTINANTAKTLAVEFGQFLAVFALAPPHDRREQVEACAILHPKQDINHLADGLAFDRQACGGRVRNPDTRPQQAHIVINLGHGTDGRARIARGCFLFNRDGG